VYGPEESLGMNGKIQRKAKCVDDTRYGLPPTVMCAEGKEQIY
jgi:hypothetical protein